MCDLCSLYRDNLRCLALTLRQVVRELAGYLTTCEDELNRSIVGELLKLATPTRLHQSATQNSHKVSSSRGYSTHLL